MELLCRGVKNWPQPIFNAAKGTTMLFTTMMEMTSGA